MVQVDWSDPQVFWLNLTNAALGLVILICFVVVVASAVRELARRRRDRAKVIAHLDDELRSLVNSYDVGVTMADGGEPVDGSRNDANS